jgi:hypothetical protein
VTRKDYSRVVQTVAIIIVILSYGKNFPKKVGVQISACGVVCVVSRDSFRMETTSLESEDPIE